MVTDLLSLNGYVENRARAIFMQRFHMTAMDSVTRQLEQQNVSFNDKSPKADNLRWGP